MRFFEVMKTVKTYTLHQTYTILCRVSCKGEKTHNFVISNINPLRESHFLGDFLWLYVNSWGNPKIRKVKRGNGN